MPANTYGKQPITGIKPIAGTPWQNDYHGDPSTCSFCDEPATKVGMQMRASHYSSKPTKRRHLRLCDKHAAKHEEY